MLRCKVSMIYILVVQVRVQQYDSIYGVACGVRCSILLDTLEPLHLSPGRLGQASTQCRRPKREREKYITEELVVLLDNIS